ncbi:MAG: bile acid:sodium symporter family protein [Candidatus Hydrogenedentes bacterium]|nr:bile acid:sodium symporter family protein [Candidatus Hydrogenedentota bacterium]
MFIFRIFSRLIVLWVILLGILGYTYPHSLKIFEPYKDWFFIITMVGIGIVLRPEDFIPIIKAPYWVLLGTLAQFTIMPLGGFFVAKILNLPPKLAVGVIIAGATPGAMASNVISYLAGADVAYSVALTSTSTLLSPIITPLWTYILGSVYLSVPFWDMFMSIVKMVILPLICGFGIRYFLGDKVNKIIEVFPALSTLCIAFICGLVVALNAEKFSQLSILVFLAVILHNFLGLSLGYFAGILYRFDEKRKRTLAIEVGMQNAGLGAVLALNHFSSETALPNALFATWCIVTASILAEFWRRIDTMKVRNKKVNLLQKEIEGE